MSPAADPVLIEAAAARGVATWYETAGHRRVDIDPAVVRAVMALLDPRPASPLPGPPITLPEVPRTWGWMIQLYGVRSAGSWGVGDFADLAAFTRWAAASGAGVVLVNPLHAVAPVDPMPASPYSPSSRRFVNPLYLHVESLPEYSAAAPSLRAEVDALRPPATSPTTLIDYNTAWRAKRTALELLFTSRFNAINPDNSDTTATRDFATYMALAEAHGVDWREWPPPLRRPGPEAYAAANPTRAAFHAWLQQRCAEQLQSANAAAAGMPIGIIHDLAVGIDPGGADAWTLQDVIAQDARVGAPPDAFNQQGQDWGLATWRPDRLAATDYAAYRNLLRGILAHAGGLRVDHIAGLWRLWWIPPGHGAAEGAYVHYDPAAMLGVLIEEATRAGAVIVGEDLGTVEPVVTTTLHERNILGSSVLWFTRDDTGAFIPPAQWPSAAMASISTHDLPTATGFLTGEHVHARAAAGVLTRSVAAEQRAAEADRAALLELLAAEGLLPTSVATNANAPAAPPADTATTAADADTTADAPASTADVGAAAADATAADGTAADGTAADGTDAGGADPVVGAVRGVGPADAIADRDGVGGGRLDSAGTGGDVAAIVEGMHRLLARSPCRVLLASPYDVLGEMRQPNLPGTDEQYPNWRIPLPMLLEDLMHDSRMRKVAEVFERRDE